MLSFKLMPWQEHVLDVALEVDSDTGLLVYREVVLTVPRQSGKTVLLLCLCIWRALGFSEPQVIKVAAQSGVEARDKLLDEQMPLLSKSPLKHRFKTRRTTGHEAILWNNGSIHSLLASTKRSGHGKTVDMAVIDEAFAQIDSRLEQSCKPAMITRPQPQTWVVSTAGDADSIYLLGKVKIGRERAELGMTEGLCYFEWSADDNDDPGSVETWKSVMPALKHPGNPGGTQPIEAVAAEFAGMELVEFKRAFLNIWNTGKGTPVIAAADWRECVDHRSMIDGPACFAFDVSPDSSSGAIAAAGVSSTDPAAIHVDIADHREGTGWMVERLHQIQEKHKPAKIVCDAGSPAGALLTDLDSKGVKVTVMSLREHQQACGAFLAGTKEHHVRTVNEPELAAAVEGANQRNVGDGWLWNRRTSSVDISPLVAATQAHWAARQNAKKIITVDNIGIH